MYDSVFLRLEAVFSDPMEDRHGSPFPLRLRPVDERNRRNLPRYLARRLRKRDSQEAIISDAVAGLNALSLARASGDLEFKPPDHATVSQPITASEDAVLRNLGRSLAHTGEYVGRETFQDGALCELLRSSSVYNVEDDCTVAPYVEDRVRVLRGDLEPKAAVDLLADADSELLRSPDKHIFFFS